LCEAARTPPKDSAKILKLEVDNLEEIKGELGDLRSGLVKSPDSDDGGVLEMIEDSLNAVNSGEY
jgi:hypothetical protein